MSDFLTCIPLSEYLSFSGRVSISMDGTKGITLGVEVVAMHVFGVI